jgi:hypothetical protein
VVKPGGAALEQGSDDHDAMAPGSRRQSFGAGSGNGLRTVELADVLRLTKVRAVMQFLQQHEPGAGPGRFLEIRFDLRQIGVRRTAIAILDECHDQLVRHEHFLE